MIHVTSLADDYYYLESGTHTLVGRRSGRRHRLGDREVVRIAHVDVDRRELDLVLADSPMGRADFRRRETGRDRRESGIMPPRPGPASAPSRPRHPAGRPGTDPAEPPSRARKPGGGPKKGKIKSKARPKPGGKSKSKKGRKKR